MSSLIPFAPEHFRILAGWFESQAEVVRWGGPLVSYPVDNQQLQAMLAQAEASSLTRLCWMGEHEGALIGHAQLVFDWRNGNAALTRVAIAPSARGRGLAGPMLRQIIREAFARPEIARLELYVYNWNTPAIRSYLRLGFKAEGVRRSSTLVEGERWDSALMGLLRSEWTDIRGS